jgi:hypothetical protein
MRIVAGVLLLLIGIFSLVEGGCVAVGCHTAAQVGSAIGAATKALDKKGTGDDIKRAAAQAGLADLEKMAAKASSLTAVSLIIRVAGLLCLVAGILCFVNKAKMFNIIAPAIGILAEVVLIAMMAFTTVGLVKIIVYAIGLFGATKVGESQSA